MHTNPVLGLISTILLFLTGCVHFVRSDVGKFITMEDGQVFRIFRHVRIRSTNEGEPQGIFIVRFRPQGMTIGQNIHFSMLPMLALLGFHGFREKYWCVDEATGLCQGIYAWQTMGDAEAYSRSIAMRFMANRSDPQSVRAWVLCRKEAGQVATLLGLLDL